MRNLRFYRIVKFTKKRIFTNSAFRFPYEKLTLFKSPAAVFFFDKSQKKTAAGQRDGGYAPATPFGVRSAEFAILLNR